MVKAFLYVAWGGTCVGHTATRLTSCFYGFINVGASGAVVRKLEAMRAA